MEEEIKDTSSFLYIQKIDAALLKKVNVIFKGDDYSLREVAFSVAKKLIEPNLTFNKELMEKKKMAFMALTSCLPPRRASPGGRCP